MYFPPTLFHLLGFYESIKYQIFHYKLNGLNPTVTPSHCTESRWMAAWSLSRLGVLEVWALSVLCAGHVLQKYVLLAATRMHP